MNMQQLFGSSFGILYLGGKATRPSWRNTGHHILEIHCVGGNECVAIYYTESGYDYIRI